jgi:hypothetical protein
VYDSHGFYLWEVIKITVEDTMTPTWDQDPENKFLEFGGSFSYDLNASDPSGINSWDLNDTTYFNIDSDGIITNLGQVPEGDHWLNVSVYDSHGFCLWYVFKISVEDTKGPTWEQVPENKFLEFGESFSYDLNASDPSGISSWDLNDTTYFNIDNDGVINNVDQVSKGEYWLNVSVYDSYGFCLWDVIKITVEDANPPTWKETPTNQFLEFGESFSYDLNASDPSGINLWDLNDTTYFNIDNDGVITNVGQVPIGEHWLNVSVYDSHGLCLWEVIIITVEDTMAPTWEQVPENKFFEFGQPFSYDLNASDLSDINEWILNNTNYFTIDANGVIANMEQIPIGDYWLNISVGDIYNNILWTVIKINVEASLSPIVTPEKDSTSPTWDQSPKDQRIELGTNFIYDLNASDASGISFWEINNTIYFEINETTGLITNTNLIPVGQHWLKISVYDSFNNSLWTVFNITVEDTTPPTWIQFPEDRSIYFDENIRYDLNASDLSSITRWEINDSTYFSIDDNGVITNIGQVPVGEYWLNVSVYDPYNNYLGITIKIIVENSQTPVLPLVIILITTISGGAVTGVLVFLFFKRKRLIP